LKWEIVEVGLSIWKVVNTLGPNFFSFLMLKILHWKKLTKLIECTLEKQKLPKLPESFCQKMAKMHDKQKHIT
jgi:hypothetical protein